MKIILTCCLSIISLTGISQKVNFDWAVTMGDARGDFGHSIAADASGNVLITGYFTGIVDFDPSPAEHTLHSNGFRDIFILKLDAHGKLLWVIQMGGGGFDVGNSISLDSSGNVYTTGFFSGKVDFDPSAGVSNLISNGDRDIFIHKVDANGNFIWVNQMGGAGDDSGESIFVDGSGNVYSTGFFEDTADFNPGSGITNLTSSGGSDIFVQKLDVNGNYLWAKQAGGSNPLVYQGDDIGYSITVDNSGSVYTTGVFRNTVDFNPGSGKSDLTSNGLQDIFILKLDANGNFLWVSQMGGVAYDVGHCIAVDASGNVYTTGSFFDSVDFDPGPGISDLSSNGANDIFIQKLDTDGNLLWVKQIGEAYSDVGRSIDVDASDMVYIIGGFTGTVDFDPGIGVSTLSTKNIYYRDIFIQKLDVDGDFLWVKQIEGPFTEYGLSITVDISGNVYSTGSFDDKVDFDPGPAVNNLISYGGPDIFIQKLHASGIGIFENDFDVEIKPYPNPTNGNLSIDLGKKYHNVMVSIFDLSGRIIQSKSYVSSQKINLKFDKPAGMYILIVESDGRKAAFRISKE